MKRELTILDSNAEQSQADYSAFQNIITENLQFIEKQCFKAVKTKLRNDSSPGNSLNIENEALELNNQVLDTLKRDNYHVLRGFKGNSRITTYITAIISRQAVDLIRKKLGRNRDKDRAKQLGDTGLMLYQQVIKNGIPLTETYKELQKNGTFSGTLEELEELLQKIKGKSHNPAPQPGSDGTAVKKGIVLDENNVIVPDTQKGPDNIFLEKEREKKIREVLSNIIRQLNGEERILLRMRFQNQDDQRPMSVEVVAKTLGISQKAVYKRIARLQQKCRKMMNQEDVKLDTLLYSAFLCIIVFKTLVFLAENYYAVSVGKHYDLFL